MSSRHHGLLNLVLDLLVIDYLFGNKKWSRKGHLYRMGVSVNRKVNDIIAPTRARKLANNGVRVNHTTPDIDNQAQRNDSDDFADIPGYYPYR